MMGGTRVIYMALEQRWNESHGEMGAPQVVMLLLSLAGKAAKEAKISRCSL